MITRKITKEGYIALKIGSKWVFEHILVAERILGRKLTENERVHHKNFEKTDNRPENLVLFESQKAHAHWHRQFEQFGATKPLLRIIQENSIINVAKRESAIKLSSTDEGAVTNIT